MKNLLGFLCFALLAQGIGGVLYELTDGGFRLWNLTHRMDVLAGYELFASIALIVLGLALGGAVSSARR